MPDSKSRDQIGKETQVSLKEYFNTLYGDEDGVPYQKVGIHGVALGMQEG